MSAPKTTARPVTTAQRRQWLRVSAAVLGLLFAILFFPRAFLLPWWPKTQDAPWFLLSAVAYVSGIAFLLMLGRQFARLYVERRANVLGARFRTKLVLSAFALSLLPVLCMFYFTQALLNRTLQSWFSQPMVTVSQDIRGISELIANRMQTRLRRDSQRLLRDPAIARALARPGQPGLQPALAAFLRRSRWPGAFAVISQVNGSVLARVHAPPDWRELPPNPLPAGAQAKPKPEYLTMRLPLAGPRRPAYLELGRPLPARLTARLRQLRADYARYQQLNLRRRTLHRIYTGYLLLLTAAVLFVATWFALFLSKLITVPVAALAEATREISSGNLRHRIEIDAKDEIGQLVTSFNRMAEELETGREQLEAAGRSLREANRELERRRQQVEVLLEQQPAAVFTCTRTGILERRNPGLERMFGPAALEARHWRDLLDPQSRQALEHLCRKAGRLGAAAGQLEIQLQNGRSMSAAATVAPIPLEGAGTSGSGFIVVLEDLTDLLRMQQTAAWREVARRMAHEIKNPLTPIRLSAQRIQRWLGRAPASLEAGERGLLEECAATIETETLSMKRLVDAFGDFARFPVSRPAPGNLNRVLEDALRAFHDRLQGLEIQTKFDEVPELEIDADAIKRVFINLIDNAAEAMRDAKYPLLRVTTHRRKGYVEAMIADTGHGIADSEKSRLFLPYYSSRQRGTGLGLAIVAQILDEHNAAIRVEDNIPMGTRMIVSFPIPRAQAPPAEAGPADPALARSQA